MTTMSTSAATAYTKAEAKAHDATLAQATIAARTAGQRLANAVNAVHLAAGDTRTRAGNAWTMTTGQATDAAGRIVDNNAPGPGRGPAAAALTALAAAQRSADEARAVVDELDEIWRTHGQWSRFFVVPGGHIHSSTACHSLRITTQIGWLPELSGETEADAVAAHGPVLCTKCFPSAPVQWTAKAPKPTDPQQCEGSGKYVPDANMRLCSPRGTCPVCGQLVSVTSLAKARKHKPS